MSPMSPGSRSAIIESDNSPLRIPPPYRAPPQPEANPINMVGIPETQSNVQYRDCVDEFKNAISVLRNNDNRQNIVLVPNQQVETDAENSVMKSQSQEFPLEKSSSKDSIRKSSSASSIAQPVSNNLMLEDSKNDVKVDGDENNENKISVKEAMRKFNRIASQEEARITSPPGKIKKPEKVSE